MSTPLAGPLPESRPRPAGWRWGLPGWCQALLWACSERNPWVLHELNIIRRDPSFIRMASLMLLLSGLFIWLLPALSRTLGGWVMRDGLPLLIAFLALLHLGYRLRRPHIRYHGDNAVFLCLLPREAPELFLGQIIGVLYQPVLLVVLALPLLVLLAAQGAVPALHLAAKLVILLLLLLLQALFGVTRVPRLLWMLLAFPIALVALLTAASMLTPVLWLVVQNVLQHSPLQAAFPNFTTTVTSAIIIGTCMLLYPWMILLLAVNPIALWLAQSTPVLRWMADDPDLGHLLRVWSAALNSIPLQPLSPWLVTLLQSIAKAYDAIFTTILLTPWGWLVWIGAASLLARDAWSRGLDQFEYFRSRGFPERFRELRRLERERLQTRNLRVFAHRCYRYGSAISHRCGTGLAARLLLGLGAWFLRPLAPGLARRAMAQDPEAFMRHWTLHAPAPARRARTMSPARRSVAPAAAPQVTVADSTLPATALAAPDAALTPAPITTPALSPAAPAPPPAFVIRPRRLPRWVVVLVSWMRGLYALVLRSLTGLLPPLIRTSPVFERDQRFLLQILRGEREGVWGYSWTVLLLITLFIASFVYLLSSVVRLTTVVIDTLVRLRGGGLIMAQAFGDIELTYGAEFAMNYLGVLLSSCPLVFWVLPIYAWLKERNRTDWEVYSITTLPASTLLAAKCAFFLMLGFAGVLSIGLLTLLLNPLLLAEPVLAALTPGLSRYSPLGISPLALPGYLVLLMGSCACAYQLGQLLSYLVLCLPLPGGAKSGGVNLGAVAIGLALAVVVVIAAVTAMPFSAVDSFYLLMEETEQFLLYLNSTILLPVALLTQAVSKFLAVWFPLFPWVLWDGYWNDSVPARTGIWLHTEWTFAHILLKASFLWGTALLAHRLSAWIYETRLRSSTPLRWQIAPRWKWRRTAARPASSVVQSAP